jgi:5-methylcytosine-specific restriction protein B
MLDERIKKDLLDRYSAKLEQGELPSKEQLDKYYATFRRRFGPEVLAGLDGEALLTTMHLHGNRDSLVYWLEFKNDDEFPGTQFGSILGGSALKFGIYRSKPTGTWMTGSALKPVELTAQEAIAAARRHRDQILAGADVLSRMSGNADDATYAKLQADLVQVAPEVESTAWGHKYFSLLFPDKLDQIHTAGYQRHHLVKLLQQPPETDGRYACAGRFVMMAQELGAPIFHLMWLLYERNGDPHRYWRVGTSDGKHPRKWWDAMRDGGFAAVGWADVGDLSGILYSQSSKDVVHQRMATSYPSTPQGVGRSAQQLFYFASVVKEGDIVLASDDATTLGIGRVNGEYQFVTGSEFPHRRAVDWLSLEEWGPAKPEGLQTTVHQIREIPNQIEIERRLLSPVPPPVVVTPPKHSPDRQVATSPGHLTIVPPLPGIPGRLRRCSPAAPPPVRLPSTSL